MRETPGYIPNPEAKPYSADGTAGGTLWESRTPPNYYSEWWSPDFGPGATTFLLPGCAINPVTAAILPGILGGHG